MNKIVTFAMAAAIATPAAAASTVTVQGNPAAPTSNFGAPTNEATVGYTITLDNDGSQLNGTIQQTDGAGQQAGTFANLYFDLNPTVGDGSDLGFEMGSGGVTAFIPGKNGQPGFNTVLDASLYTFMTSTTAGLTTINFSLANSLFTGPIAGLAYYDGQTFEATQTLRLSQSLSYSVAGGASYGPDRLGAFSVGGAVPEPATWTMMLLGFGGIGMAMRRSKRTARLALAA